MIKKILKYPNKILEQVSKDVEVFNEELNIMLDDMKDTLDDSEGVGLAAIQIGVPLNVLLVKYNDTLIEAINPDIVHTIGERTELEGCLSIPNVNEYVTRANEITIEYYDRNNNLCVRTCNGMEATIWQHELEHLNGGLYIDNLSSGKRKKLEDNQKDKIRSIINSQISFNGTKDLKHIVANAIIDYKTELIIK